MSTTTPSNRLPLAFWALNIIQSLAVFNSNLFRWVVIWALATRCAAVGNTIDENQIFIVCALLAVPYILFSSAAGVLADRYSKRSLIVLWNLVAVVLMLFGALALLSNIPFLIYASIFLLATQSALFSPNKYGILPELVPREKLSQANGLMESALDLSIVLGTLAGGLAYGAWGQDVAGASTAPCWKAGILCCGIAVVATLGGFFIPPTEACASGKKLTPYFWQDVYRNIASVRGNRYLLMTLFAIGFFYFIGAFVQNNIAAYGIENLGLSKSQANNLFLALAIGIASGAFFAGKLSRRSAEIGLVPVGGLLMSVAAFLFALPVSHAFLPVLFLMLLGFGGGFYIVPLNTFLQDAAPEENRGELIATANFLQFSGMILAALLLKLMSSAGMLPGARFAVLGVITLLLTLVVLRVLPDFFIRFIGLVTARILYRLEVDGIENVPREGGALLVGNHVSYADAVLIGAAHQRRIRFIMDRDIYNSSRFFNFIFRMMRVIPVSQKDSPKQTIRTLRVAREALDEGYLVCIFAEGGLTRTGYINEFKRGMEHIVKGSQHPIIPVCLHGIWGSILSYSHGKLLGRIPRPLRRRITVYFGAPLPTNSNAFDVRLAVMELQAKAYDRDRVNHNALPLEFARVARANWGRFCMADTTGKNLSYGQTLTAATALANALRLECIGQECVGILLPTSTGSALANIAVSLLSRVAVNLNYTASNESIRDAIEQAGITRIITSRAFLERFAAFQEMDGLLFMEDIAVGINKTDKVCAWLQARFLPVTHLLEKRQFRDIRLQDKSIHSEERRRPTPEDTAVILFSSGSTGYPKGVLLSHYNIFSNAQAAEQVFRLTKDDIMLGVLPLFHSFGLTVTLWLPLLAGAGVAYHFNPTETERVGNLCATHGCTLLIATPTFLNMYTRKISPQQFVTLRTVITGAEKLKLSVANAFEARFGLTPTEGYGATELSPVASFNQMSMEIGGVTEEAHRFGSIGRPLPGVVMKIADPNDLNRDLGYGHEGLLLVKGPNVMQGYLGQPEKTDEVIRDGWYVTGDIASIEHDGFVTITGRLSRFSKIGGEMVPHQLIEEKLQEMFGATEQVCAVTAAPDDKKGEQLVVLLTPSAGSPAEAHAHLRASGLPNLWLPPAKNYFVIDAIPVLGSGKTDLKALKTLAENLVQKDALTNE